MVILALIVALSIAGYMMAARDEAHEHPDERIAVYLFRYAPIAALAAIYFIR